MPNNSSFVISVKCIELRFCNSNRQSLIYSLDGEYIERFKNQVTSKINLQAKQDNSVLELPLTYDNTFSFLFTFDNSTSFIVIVILN